MVLDPVATSVGGGGIVTVVWLFLKYKPWTREAPRNGRHLGDLEPAFWEKTMRDMIERVLDNKLQIAMIEHEEQMASMLKEAIKEVFSGRNEMLREMLRQELQHFYGLTGSKRWRDD